MTIRSESGLVRLCIFVLALPWILESLLFLVTPSELSVFRYTEPTVEEYLGASFLLAIFVVIVWSMARIGLRVQVPSRLGKALGATRGIEKGCITLLPLFTVLSLIFIYSSFREDLLSTVLAFRLHETSIGYLGYSILYFFPMIVTVTWGRNSLLSNSAFIGLIAFTNLLTGYRTLLITSLIMIGVYNIDVFSSLSRRVRTGLISACVGISLTYEGIRSGLEANRDIGWASAGAFLDSIIRSYPVCYTALTIREGVSAGFWDLTKVLASPFSILVENADRGYDLEGALSLTDQLVGSYLAWRGTPLAIASGFSIHIVPFASRYYGFIGVVLFAVIVGLSLGIGINLSRFRGILPRMAGATLIVFSLSTTEAFESAYVSLLYRLSFLLPMVVFSVVDRSRGDR